ncbi:biotin--[acetyl-CoA-carboxylase] ligase [Leptolyngbya sp. 'hensonii']|uniref:biotin--[acetyl-CoA-carboxylase] ligase n=1 Tax=Leptolyngbya sp. 'hensonii' TaxID=1922337 RepID=UPI00094FB83E|nr:biotin--[acetyl-CoA-carboxylase] ligase [Leptolyngbya sp. 'hensonii']OLP17732.1 biotin--[acetyl-CoA-carboxylase] ligase [Leptolyngbya sp. 'hensonii']
MGFDRDQFDAALRSWWERSPNLAHSTLQPATLALHLFPTLPSTNQTAWELLQQGATSGTVVIALEQQAGRGQWGRQWKSAPGGLYLSIGLAPELEATEAAQLTFATAWGIASSLRLVGVPVQLKWPNDLVLQARKLGGILTETRIQQGRITQAVVGVGLNWNNPVPKSGINLQTFWANASATPLNSLEELAALVLYGIVLGQEFRQSQAIQSLLTAYLEFLVNLGDSVVIEGRSGTITGVSPTGELQVRLQPDPDHLTSGPDGVASEDVETKIWLKPGTISLGYGGPDHPDSSKSRMQGSPVSD